MGVITVARQYGSEGEQIARLLSERLGYRYVDRPLLEAEAHRMSAALPDAFNREVDERAPNIWERLNEERRRYAVLLQAIICQLADQGNIVIVGRSAGILLRNVGHAFNVLTVAPAELRIRRVAASEKLSPAAAAERVRQADENRAGYIHHLFGVNWLDPTLYDLSINTSKVTPEAAVELLAQTAASPAFQPTATSLQALRDLALNTSIQVLLATQLGYGRIQVGVRNGEVALQGAVWSDEEEDLILQLVRNQPGVRQVVSQLRREVSPFWF